MVKQHLQSHYDWVKVFFFFFPEKKYYMPKLITKLALSFHFPVEVFLELYLHSLLWWIKSNGSLENWHWNTWFREMFLSWHFRIKSKFCQSFEGLLTSRLYEQDAGQKKSAMIYIIRLNRIRCKCFAWKFQTWSFDRYYSQASSLYSINFLMISRTKVKKQMSEVLIHNCQKEGSLELEWRI